MERDENRVRGLWDTGTCNLVCINMDITVYNCLQYLISSDSRLGHSSAALSLQGIYLPSYKSSS